jgi:hypothetical protein
MTTARSCSTRYKFKVQWGDVEENTGRRIISLMGGSREKMQSKSGPMMWTTQSCFSFS